MKPAIPITAAAFLFAAASVARADAPAAAPAKSATKPASIIDTPADVPSVKMDFKTGAPQVSFLEQHEKLVAKAKKGGVDLYFAGDSITDRWGEKGAAVWKKEMAPWKAGAFGIGGDRTQHLLWRLQNWELEGVNPKAFVVMIGSNNIFDYKPEQIAAGTGAVVKLIAERFPKARILVLGMLPLDEKADNPYRQRIKNANAITAKLDDGKNIKYMDIGSNFLAPDGTQAKGIFVDGAHLSEKGYQIYADAIKPVLTEWLGPPFGAAAATQGAPDSRAVPQKIKGM